MNTLRTIATFGVTLGTIAGCVAALPPQDLVTARTAYSRASNDGSTAQRDPRDLDAARKQLALAEASFK